MKFLFALLIAFAMTANAYATATAQSRVCCVSDECDIVQCLDMGCLPAVSPVAMNRTTTLATQASVRDMPVEVNHYLSNRYKKIWTPPD